MGRHVGGVVDVLQRDWHAAQRQRAQLVGVLPRVRARALDVEMRECADIVLARRNRGGAEIDDALGREFAGFDAAREIEGGEQAVGTGEHFDFSCSPLP